MRHLKFVVLLPALFIMTNCENKEKSVNLVNLTVNAKIVGFVTEKCYCCWGWEIEVESTMIKADSIPGLNPSAGLVFPFDARITIGEHTRDCSTFSKSDYYEINNIPRSDNFENLGPVENTEN